MKYIIFYSWQSDLPNNTNRSFIESALQAAVSEINTNDNFELEPTVDRDTQGVPGAPNISQSVLDKIKACDAFVADISIVTGDTSVGKRLSPNPNVLIELGYAVALLGWKKIVLVCNTEYGDGEDLPFDIRQHRRISYSLKQQDEKASTRKQITSQLRAQLSVLLEHGKQVTHKKSPKIYIQWHGLGEEHSDDIPVKRMKDLAAETIVDLKEKNDQIDRIDGSVDPKWPESVAWFKKRASETIESLSNPELALNYVISKNTDIAKAFTICVANIGNSSATDIRVNIHLPEWLQVYSKLPKSEVVVPLMPTPSPPRPPVVAKTYATAMGIRHNELSMPSLRTRTSACYEDGQHKIHFWADRLLHKHQTENADDKLYLIALPSAPIGEHEISYTSFCSELDDWVDGTIIVKVE
jgi:hypothetical protein